MNNDLISRDALKLTIENFQIFNPKLSVYDVLKIIDKAPTVEQNWRFYYDHGYAQAKRDFERPQGEWIKHEDWINEGGCGYECSCCGRTYDYDMNFCGYCGADMRGDSHGQ